MTIEEWLNNDQLGIDIWNKKYRCNSESLDEWFDRVSGGDQELRKLIVAKKFLFGGRILSGRGINNVKCSLSNCYVIAPPEDSIESIFECGAKIARTFSYGGGCGIDISKLRPFGAKVNNSAKTTSDPSLAFNGGLNENRSETLNMGAIPCLNGSSISQAFRPNLCTTLHHPIFIIRSLVGCPDRKSVV